jgi:hypothetical protein
MTKGSWADVDSSLPAMDALRKCFRDGIMTNGDRFWTFVVTYGVSGTTYGGYRHVTLAEIEERKAKVIWFEGLEVHWTDVVRDDRPGRIDTRTKFTDLSPEHQQSVLANIHARTHKHEGPRYG